MNFYMIHENISVVLMHGLKLIKQLHTLLLDKFFYEFGLEQYAKYVAPSMHCSLFPIHQSVHIIQGSLENQKVLATWHKLFCFHVQINKAVTAYKLWSYMYIAVSLSCMHRQLCKTAKLRAPTTVLHTKPLGVQSC